MSIFLRKKFLLVFIFFFVGGFYFLPASFEMINAQESVAQDYFDQDIIVKLKNNPKVYKLDSKKVDRNFILNNFERNSLIEYAEPNFLWQAALIPNDPDFIQQYYLKQVKAPESWDISQGSAEVVVAVLDSGVDIKNPDLQHNIWVNTKERQFDQKDNDNNGLVDDFYGWNFVDDNNDITPIFKNFTELGVSHGTIIAGILGARGNNGQGISGAAWNIKIMPLKVLDSSGYGDSLSVVRAIEYAIAQQVDVINLSVVGHNFSQALQQAITNAWQAGIVVVAAAGNEIGQGADMDIYPAYPVCNDSEENTVIGVVAVDKNNKLAAFSNYGSRCSDVAAPGINFYSTVAYHPSFPGFNHHYKGGFSGTSVATPLVSGLAALIKSINPDLSPAQIRNIILNTATDISNQNLNYAGQLGKGLIDFNKALGAAKATLAGVARPISQDLLVTGAGAGGGPHVRVFDFQGNVVSQFFAYDEKFRGGVNVSSADVDGDDQAEIITAAGAGGGPHVRVFDTQGNIISQFFAYDEKFRGGVNVSSADVDGDGQAEIITAPMSGMEAIIKIFDKNGHMRFKYLAYADNFLGGANIATSDLDGNGTAEIITGAGAGGGPHVRIFTRQGNIISQFFAYDEKFRGGVNVSSADVDGDGQAEIITGAGAGGGPHVRVFTRQGNIISQFFAFSPDWRSGVRVVSGDMNGDKENELIVAPNFLSSPEVRIYSLAHNLMQSFMVYHPAFDGGVSLDIIGRP